MANSNRDSGAIIEQVGGKPISAPRTFKQHYVRGGQEWTEGQVLLVAIIDTPYGDHLKEVSYQVDLDAIRRDPMVSASFFELGKPALDTLRKTYPRVLSR